MAVGFVGVRGAGFSRARRTRLPGAGGQGGHVKKWDGVGEGEGQEPGSLGREGGAVSSGDLATGSDLGVAAEPGDELRPEEGAWGGTTEQRSGCAEPGASGQGLRLGAGEVRGGEGGPAVTWGGAQ